MLSIRRTAPELGVGPAVRPVRVLHVLEATIGGTKRHLVDLLTGLRERPDLQLEVASPLVRDEHHGDTSFVADVQALGIPVHLVSMRRSIDPRSDGPALARLAMLIRRGRYDVLHLHSSKAGALGRAAAWLAFLDVPKRRPKIIFSPHGFAFLIPGSPARAHLYASIERALGRLTDCLVAISEDERNEALQRAIVPLGRTRVVRNGVTPEALPYLSQGEAKRRSMGWGDRGATTVIGTVGRMTPQKDPFTWLTAAARALVRQPGLRFVWIMGGELEHEVHALARSLGLDRDGRLQFLGYRADARELIAAMDVFALSSVFEAGLPYVLMEAMALERPVVATACSGSRELIHDGINGYLVPPGDAEALADRMVHLAADAVLRRSLGQAGSQLVLQLCTTSRQVGDMHQLYRQVLGLDRYRLENQRELSLPTAVVS